MQQQQHGYVLQYASEPLQGNPEVVLAAVQQTEFALDHAATCLEPTFATEAKKHCFYLVNRQAPMLSGRSCGGRIGNCGCRACPRNVPQDSAARGTTMAPPQKSGTARIGCERTKLRRGRLASSQKPRSRRTSSSSGDDCI
eukprot:2332708-Amphidinium_carterae.1